MSNVPSFPTDRFFDNKASSTSTVAPPSFVETSSSSMINESSCDSTSASNTSSKSKKKRWGILMGRSKSGEKVKSATLGREKKKKEDDQSQGNNRHRWSTGLPRFNPLPPSISKETMVLNCVLEISIS